jgi:hypothetical protein
MWKVSPENSNPQDFSADVAYFMIVTWHLPGRLRKTEVKITFTTQIEISRVLFNFHALFFHSL